MQMRNHSSTEVKQKPFCPLRAHHCNYAHRAACRQSAVNSHEDGVQMRKLSCLVITLGLLMSVASQAEAKGCLKGAAVGGAAGHIKDHAVAGAAAGCAVGHHMAHKQEKKDAEKNQQQAQ